MHIERSSSPWHRLPVWFAVVGAAVWIGAAPEVYAQLRVAVIDMARAVRESDQGVRAAAQLRVVFEQRQHELDRRSQALQHLREDLERQRSVLTADAYTRASNDYAQQLQTLQNDFQTYQRELQEREAELTKQIYTNLQKVVGEVRVQQNYDVVVDRGGVIITTQLLEDATDRVMEAYNRAYPAGDAGVTGADAHTPARAR